MGADPELKPVAFVAALRGTVEDRVVVHQELHAAIPCGIRVVDSSVIPGEGAEALALGEVADDVGTGIVSLPRLTSERLNPPTPEQVARILDATPEPYKTPLAHAAFGGLRRGEALGLRWSDVDLDRRVLFVRQAATFVGREITFDRPKSRDSERAEPARGPARPARERESGPGLSLTHSGRAG